jgi:membrane protease YdiL (CAAX protease family)
MMAVNTYFGEINAEFKFPEFLSGLENWARRMEDQLMEQTKFLTTFESRGYFILAVLIIAIIPAFGEELLFRGVVQNLFRHLVRNVHVAIWLSSFLFALMHFQFYGLLPRMLLGALFGYLYYWSSNLWIPIAAHLINNFLLLALLYSNQTGKTDFDVESTESLPISAILLFSLVVGFSLFLFRKFYLRIPLDGKLGSSV